MDDQYNAIKRARALLAAIPKSVASVSTRGDYLTKVQRLRARGENQGGGMFDGAIAAALKTKKKTGWQTSRAALLYCARNGLEGYLAKQDEVQRRLKGKGAPADAPEWALWRAIVDRMAECSHALESVLDAKLPLEGRSNRHTKRQDMHGLPNDWRERIVARMPNYAPATLTAAVTGCRPAELVVGIQLWIEDGMLIARIKGAKVDVAGRKGQEWRQLSWPLDHPSSMVRDLARTVQAADGALMVKINCAKNFSKAISNAVAREWPKRKTAITPYWFRHQFASDVKADGRLHSGEISAAMGHLSDITKSTYGHANMSKGGGVAPKKVSAARPVKMASAAKVKVKVRI